MTERLNIMVKVERTTVDDIPNSLEKCIDYFIDMLAKVPLQFKDWATIEFEPYGEDDSAYCDFNVYYARPETDEEMAARNAEEAEHLARMERRRVETEQAELRRLAALHPTFLA